MNIIIEIVVGLLAGVAASMGLGGGFIILIYLSAFTNTPQDIAQGVNLLFFLPIAVLSVCIHAKNKLIEWKLILQYVITGAVGAILGCILAFSIETALLRKLFAIMILAVGIKELFHKNNSKTNATENSQKPDNTKA